MKVNFEIIDCDNLSFEGRVLDLHNNFDFERYEYNIANRLLTLVWTKSTGDWAPEDEFSRLILAHHNVFFFRVGYENVQYEYPDDDKCLSSVSFFPSSDREINNGCIYQQHPNEGDDIIYVFQTDHFIRVGCDHIVLSVEK